MESLNAASLQLFVGTPDSLPKVVAGKLTQLIKSGEIGPGDKLPTEPQLCAAFGVSRNVLREAISSLRLKGVLEVRRGIGVFVSAEGLSSSFVVDPDELLAVEPLTQIYQLRLEVESGAAAIAAMKRTDVQLTHIERALDRVNKAAPDLELGSDSAVDFHLEIARATNNKYIEELMAHLRNVIHKAVRTLRHYGEGTARSLHVESEHRTIFEAIRQRDADTARTAMRAHLQTGMYTYQRLLRERKTQ